jgi:hypothetical protein
VQAFMPTAVRSEGLIVGGEGVHTTLKEVPLVTHETSHLDMVITRLEKIERQNHRLKLAGACLLILGSSLLLMGQFSSTPRTVEAEHFALLDRHGKIRARLGTLGESTILSMNDQQGLIRTSLTIGEDGFPGLVFHDRHGEVRVFLGVLDGEPILGLRDSHGTQRAMLKLRKADGTPFMFMTAADGEGLWHAP